MIPDETLAAIRQRLRAHHEPLTFSCGEACFVLAHHDVRELLDGYEQLRAELAESRKRECTALCKDVEEDRDQLRAENLKLLGDVAYAAVQRDWLRAECSSDVRERFNRLAKIDGEGPDWVEARELLAKRRDVVADSPTPSPAAEYLIWSNEANAWWGPNAGGYRHDLAEAGRYTHDQAVKACGMRTWSVGRPPPEVMVEAPSREQQDGWADLKTTMRTRIAQATKAAVEGRSVTAPSAGETKGSA